MNRFDPKWVQRPRLVDVMSDALTRPLTLISAPAGFGKSVAVKQWASERSPKTIWFDNGGNYRSPNSFAYELLNLADLKASDLFPISKGLVETTSPVSTELLAKSIAADSSKLEEPTVLILDDFHQMPKIASDLILELIPRMPERLRIVLVSRIDPPLPLPLWRSRGLLSEIRASELQFQLSEISEFFEEFELGNEELQLVGQKTEGWPLALAMLRISLGKVDNRVDFLKDFSSTNRLIFDFLAEEVIHGLSPEILDFLCATATLKRFSVDLCDVVFKGLLGMRNSREMIEQILQDNLFLISRNEDNKWFRYHHLFEEVLTILAAERFGESERRGFLSSAASWFAENGSPDDAVDYFVRAGDIEAADAVLENNFQVLSRYPMSRVRLARVLDQFHDSPLTSNPIRPLARACVKLRSLDVEGQKLCIDQATELLDSLPDTYSEDRKKNLHKTYETIRSVNYFWTGSPEKSLNSALTAYELSTPDDLYSYDTSIAYKALSRYSLGDSDLAFRELSEAIEEDCGRGGERSPYFMLFDAGLKLFAGKLQQAVDSAEQMLQLGNQIAVDQYFLSYATYMVGVVAFERNDLEKARGCFEEVINSRYHTHCRVAHDSLLGLASLDIILGANSEAKKRIKEARSYATEMCDPVSLRASSGFETKLSLLRGDAIHLPIPRDVRYSGSHWLETPDLTDAEIITCIGAPSQLTEILGFVDAHIDLANGANNSWLAVKFEALRAVILAVQGNEREAQKYLMGLLRRYRTSDFVRSFVDRGPVMRKLLTELSNKNRRNGRIREILSAYSASEPLKSEPNYNRGHLSRRVHWLTPTASKELKKQNEFSLTNREMDVFLLMGERLSQKEIASRLGISRETVKKHAGSLYRKLKVNSSSEAIRLLSQDE